MLRLKLPQPVAAPGAVLATGAYLKNRALLLHGDRVLASPVHGDLGTAEACAALQDSLEGLVAAAQAAGWPIVAVAHDLHPDFPSTRAAEAWVARLDVPAIAVQHHHAHLGVVMAEQGWAPDPARPVLGLALDGVGLGSDGTAWGGELLGVTGPGRIDGAALDGADAGFMRLAHLAPLALPGGDAAAREPWRLAAAVLHALGRAEEIVPRFAPQVGEARAAGVATLLARGLRCPTSSAAGRWFDAAAAALGLAPLQQAEAEAAIALERAATDWLAQPAAAGAPPAAATLDLHRLVGGLFDETEAGRGAAAFHAALAAGLVDALVGAARAQGATRIALAGGCFYNRLLSAAVEAGCHAAGLQPKRPVGFDCGDAGLALGQAWLAAARLAAPRATPAAAASFLVPALEEN